MVGEPMRRTSTLAILLGLGLGTWGCSDNQVSQGVFRRPAAIAVLGVGDNSPFSEPVGFVANGDDGQISMLGLASGRFLSDDPHVSFLKGSQLATGRSRQILAAAAYAPSAEAVSLYALDAAFEQLLFVPYVVGLQAAGHPIEARLQTSEPLFVDSDASGGEVTFETFSAVQGRVATEDWTLRYDGEQWGLAGTRSGLIDEPIEHGQTVEMEKAGFSFHLLGDPTQGDTLTFSTDSGLREVDVGGLPLTLAIAPDQQSMALTVMNQETGAVALKWFDPLTRHIRGSVELAEGAYPGKMAFFEDSQTLLVSDRALPVVWSVDVQTQQATALALPWPISDLALLESETRDSLYVLPHNENAVWLYDLSSDSLVDLNPHTPALDGRLFTSPVQGIDSVPLDFQWAETDDNDEPLSGRAVAVSLFAGRVVWMEEYSGCLVHDNYGPRTRRASQYAEMGDVEFNYDGVPYAPYLEANAVNNRAVQVNACGGIAHSEQWQLTYRQNLQAWEVRGSLAGVQQALAIEDQRYSSDDGAVSFVVRAGGTPSQEGWEITFDVLEGVLSNDGDNDKDGTRDVALDVPGDPVCFAATDLMNEKTQPYCLIAAQATNLVGRVNPVDGEIDVSWR